MTADPAPTTDVFGFLMGEGFVMEWYPWTSARAQEEARAVEPIKERLAEARPTIAALYARNASREVWRGIGEDVADLEALLK